MNAAEGTPTDLGSLLAGESPASQGAAPGGVDAQVMRTIEAAILDSADIDRVIAFTVVSVRENELVVAAKVNVAPELTMRQVSVIVNLAERRVRSVLPAASAIYISPDVWIDPNAAQPTTSVIVLKSGN